MTIIWFLCVYAHRYTLHAHEYDLYEECHVCGKGIKRCLDRIPLQKSTHAPKVRNKIPFKFILQWFDKRQSTSKASTVHPKYTATTSRRKNCYANGLSELTFFFCSLIFARAAHPIFTYFVCCFGNFSTFILAWLL